MRQLLKMSGKKFLNLTATNMDVKRQYISSCIICVPTSRSRKRDDSNQIKQNTLFYHFIVNNKKVRVCKTYFLNTLRIVNEMIIKNASITMSRMQGKELFVKRYWGEEEERKLLYELKYGEYRGGSREEYVLKMSGLAAFLSESIEEKELKGVVVSGLTSLDDLKEYMMKIDETEAPEDGQNCDL
nr:unnamed protein product [Callosobruchus analis]